MCTLFERTMLDLGFVRLDLQGDRREWITRPRTSSHVDGILVSTDVTGVVQSCSNHDWGTANHTHLAMTVMITATIHPKTRPRGKGNRLCRVRYRYREASPREKGVYGDHT